MNKYAAAGLLTSLVLLATCSAVPGALQEQVVKNSLDMKFVRIPAGEFSMGSNETPQALAPDYPQYERQRFVELADEASVHRVRISHADFLGQHAVTEGQIRKFLEASGYVPESIADGTGGYGCNPSYDPAVSKRGDLFEGRDPKYSWRNPVFAQGDNHPVLNVTWNDAQALDRWLSRQEGFTNRLPTEAKWKYACRAGSTSRYPGIGDNPLSLPQIANTFDAAAAY